MTFYLGGLPATQNRIAQLLQAFSGPGAVVERDDKKKGSDFPQAMKWLLGEVERSARESTSRVCWSRTGPTSSCSWELSSAVRFASASIRRRAAFDFLPAATSWLAENRQPLSSFVIALDTARAEKALAAVARCG